MPTLLPGCPSYYSTHSATKRSRLSLEEKDDELLSQAISLSLESDVEEKEKFKIQSFQDIQTKLHFLPSTLSTWYPEEYTLICMRPRIDKCKIQINTYLSVEFDLSIKAFHNGERLLTSHVTL